MKRFVGWSLCAALLWVFAVGCGNSIKDPPKDLKVPPAQKTQNKARGGLDSESINLPNIPKNP
jgi:hypothetical protein